MRFFAGIMVVLGCVLGGYTAMGGSIAMLNQPFEFLIILGGAIGAYIVANPGVVLKQTIKDLLVMIKGRKHKREDYLELMAFLYSMMKKISKNGGIRGGGVQAIEKDMANPEESELFKQYPGVLSNKRAVTFITDYMKLMTVSSNVSVYEIEPLMEEELETLHNEYHRVPHAVQTMADGLPALGIVAAVMGVIKTMAHIDSPPAILGGMIGSALVGTFAGVFLSYGFVGPIAASIGNMHSEHHKYYESIKVALLAMLNGNQPPVCVELARKILFSESRPSFEEVEERTQDV